jgi:hypothetical protein
VNTSILLYPRLPRSSARRLVLERAGMDLAELKNLSALQHPDAEPSATGGRPADKSLIREVQTIVREASLRAGFPSAPGGGAQIFDRECGTALYEVMQIVPADAAEEGVWSFLSLVVCPEIGPWRFPGQPEERLLGQPRNVLRRLWWRAWALGPDLTYAPNGCDPLGEDEFVQVMERPSLGGNRRTAAAIQSALWRAEDAGITTPRSELMRQLARRARAAKSHTQFDALSDEDLDNLLDRIVAQCIS